MSVAYIYCPLKWPSSMLLEQAFQRLGVQVGCGSVDETTIINWGFRHRSGDGLNKHLVGNKLTELQKLKEAGVNVCEFTTDHTPFLWKQNQYVYVGGWLPRHIRHSQGRDMTRRLTGRRLRSSPPDYFVKKLNIIDEFRVHIINGKCVKVGHKIKMHEDAHSWVRTHRTGWRPTYAETVRVLITDEMRTQAKKAVAALRYDFGAVDIGRTHDNKIVVFEVNSAPGLKPSIADVYARHLKEMLR